MPISNSTYWNLTQALAWVVFRTPKIIEQFDGTKANSWRAFVQYPSGWPTLKDFEEPEPLYQSVSRDNKKRLERRATTYNSMQNHAKKVIEDFKNALQSEQINRPGRSLINCTPPVEPK